MLTDNKVLVNKAEQLPALMCVQRRAVKCIPTEEDFIESNISSFGNKIGEITNRATSMYVIRERFPEDSVEYKELSYRIQCMQLVQQNEIDSAKGIISKPMPRYWYDRHDIAHNAPPEKQELCHRIVAEKKPYFMRYIYPDLARQYNTYVKNTNRKALREFQMTVAELQSLPLSERTEDQQNFLNYYEKYLPVYDNDCVMNRICRRFEEEFDRYFANHKPDTIFDYRILRGKAEYTERQYNDVKKLYDGYAKKLATHSTVSSAASRRDEHKPTLGLINSRFARDCTIACPDRDVLCNLLLDICYQRASTKQFAWSLCSFDIVRNLLEKHDGIISYPTLDPDGEVELGGNKFKIESKRIEVTYGDSLK